MKAGFKHVLVASFVLSSVAAIVGWIGWMNEREENRALRQRIRLAESEELRPSNAEVDGEEISRLNRENREVLRLRNEVSQLRNLKTDWELLRKENASLREMLASESNRAQTQWLSWVATVRTKGLTAEDVPYLIQALTNEAPSVRVEATKALRNIGLRLLLDTNLTTQAELELRAQARAAAPELVSALKDPDVMVRTGAAITLGFLREQPEMTVPALVQALNDEQNRVALSAAKALGRFQRDGVGAIPALLQMAQSLDAERRAAAIDALESIDPQSVRNAGLK